ncbi:F0F1 ATP synthase subunit delta [Bacillus sp. FSL W7-1360]
MSKSAVAGRYAVALFELAEETGQVDKYEAELSLIEAVFAETPQLTQVLIQPGISLDKKEDLLVQAFKNQVSEPVFNTVLLLFSRGRVRMIAALADSYKKLNDEKKGIASATVFSAKPLNDEEARQISTTFAPKVGKRELCVENVVDATVLGGIKVRIGDRVFDGSIQGQLTRLEKQLLEAN